MKPKLPDTVPLCGYADPLSGRAGDTVAFKISSELDEDYSARLVRIICADPNPAGPGLIEETVDSVINGTYPSRRQPFTPGSCAVVECPGLLENGQGVGLTATVWPTLPDGGAQGILCAFGNPACPSVQMLVSDSGEPAVVLRLADGTIRQVTSGVALKARRWYRLWGGYEPASGQLVIGQQALDEPLDTIERNTRVADPIRLDDLDRVLIAALPGKPRHGHFNGKIESPAFFDNVAGARAMGDESGEGLLAHWDFSRQISSTRIEDIGPRSFHGNLHNLPARGMTGSTWSGREMCWRHAPEEYGAIHFHADDIVDFDWQTDLELTLTDTLQPGVYGLRLECAGFSDTIPFFVCPPQDRPTARLCVLVSTFTYIIYGNHARPDFEPSWLERVSEWQAYPWNAACFPHYGLSTYNFHGDGSGICHASHRRPLFTLRPGYLTFGTGEGSGLRHFQADSHLITWLEQQSIPYDIVTDQQLHDEGVAAISRYAAVVTGSHPEYHTRETLDALQQYRDDGGHFLYLGGNGFYWKVAQHGEGNGALEIRRGEGGIRAWAAEPGEYYNAFDGEYGGLWRRNGRPPQRLAGIGFSAQGTFTGSHYRRLPETFSDPAISWIFDGIDDEVIGDFGLSGGGAAGFELDRVDHRLGSPDGVRVLARSEGHDDTFVLVPEEQLTHLTTWPGDSPDDLIRADMVYAVNGSGGQLFASGSITFCGSLLHRSGDNNISRLLANVIRRFTGDSTGDTSS